MQAGIHGVGMVTALGLDWQTSCAAARAGVFRAEPIEYFQIQADDPWEVQHVAGHRATMLTYGFESVARYLRLMTGALADLVRQGRATGNLPVYLSLPDQSVVAEPNEEDSFDPLPVEWTDRARWADVLRKAASMARWPGTLKLEGLSFQGPAGFMTLLEQYSTSRYSEALIVALDSLLEEHQLLHLLEAKRLKTTANPIGLMPGEAGVVLRLGTAQGAMAVLGPVAFAGAETLEQSLKADSGARLATMIQTMGVDTTSWFVTDMNGEEYRGQLWGSALRQLCARPEAREAKLDYPAVSFGDTGGAAPAVATAVMLAAWSRGYAPAAFGVTAICGADQDRAALLVRKGG